MSDINLSKDSEKVIELLEKMSVLESIQLVNHLKEKWQISDAAPVAAVAEAAKEEEPTSFEVVITDASANKIAAIKLVRELKGLSLGDAKNAVENLPFSLGEFDSKDKANEVVSKFKDISVTAEIK